LDIFYKKFSKDFLASTKENTGHISFQSPLSKATDGATRIANHRAFSDSKTFDIENRSLTKQVSAIVSNSKNTSGSNQKYQGGPMQNIQNIIPSILGSQGKPLHTGVNSSSKERRSSSSKVVLRKSNTTTYNENIPNLGKKLSEIMPPKLEKQRSMNPENMNTGVNHIGCRKNCYYDYIFFYISKKHFFNKTNI
jgi:hypothetical protein